MSLPAEFWEKGWCRFPHDNGVAAWAKAARHLGARVAADPKQQVQWLRCGGTWFVGVDALPNDETGRLPNGPPLAGHAIDAVEDTFGAQRWHKAQLSVIYPGYPKPSEAERAAAFRFRRDRDAAHVDGLLPVGPERRRYLQEPHGFVLGLPLTPSELGASPMVVWEGSHTLMRTAFCDALAGTSSEAWSGQDLTDIYQTARRRCFEACDRVSIEAQPGEAYLVHRLALHGVAPWGSSAKYGPEGRMIAYFRPELDQIADWLA